MLPVLHNSIDHYVATCMEDTNKKSLLEFGTTSIQLLTRMMIGQGTLCTCKKLALKYTAACYSTSIPMLENNR